MTKSISEVRSEFEYQGITVAQWARKHNYPYHTVLHVLSGKSKYSHGKAHEIAVLLKLKEGVIS